MLPSHIITDSPLGYGQMLIGSMADNGEMGVMLVIICKIFLVVPYSVVALIHGLMRMWGVCILIPSSSKAPQNRDVWEPRLGALLLIWTIVLFTLASSWLYRLPAIDVRLRHDEALWFLTTHVLFSLGLAVVSVPLLQVALVRSFHPLHGESFVRAPEGFSSAIAHIGIDVIVLVVITSRAGDVIRYSPILPLAALVPVVTHLALGWLAFLLIRQSSGDFSRVNGETDWDMEAWPSRVRQTGKSSDSE